MKNLTVAFPSVLIRDNEGHREWLNSAEAALYLKVSVKTLLNEVSLGRIPYYKFGRRNRYLKRELDEMLIKVRGPYYDDTSRS